MIQINSLHTHHPESSRYVRSHIITPHDTVTVFCIIDGPHENIVSIIDDHFLESIAGASWQDSPMDDFGYITERYNHFIKNLETEDIAGINILIAILQSDNLSVSTIGKGGAIILEGKNNLTDISVHENGGLTFESVTHGIIPPESTIYLSSIHLENILEKDILKELSLISPEKWAETAKHVIEREMTHDVHVFRLSRRTFVSHIEQREKKHKKLSLKHIHQKGVIAIEYLRSQRIWEHTKGVVKKFPTLENKFALGSFLLVGISILFILIYILVSSMLSVLETNTDDTKHLLVQAKTLIDEGETLSNNPTAFRLKMDEAEKILQDLKKEQRHIPDTYSLIERIATIKKQVYDIQDIDLSRMGSIVPFDGSTFSPLGVYEKNKKLTLIGKEGAIIDYIPGEAIPTVKPYPSGEMAKIFDMSEDGDTAYIMTENSNIFSPRRDDFVRWNVTGQSGWTPASSIRTFNGNIYLLEEDKNQIQRHKPGVNGFSPQSNLLKKEIHNIFDFSIDGALYLYGTDGVITRYFTDTGNSNGITLNKIPGDWALDPNKKSIFITKSNLSLIYILNGNHLWIFKPNSKRFKDVTAWEYLGQFEFKTEHPIEHVFVPKDGIIYITTSHSVYDLRFELIDNKILFK